MKVHEVNVHPALPERLAWLGEIARNVWSAWSPEAGDLFSRLDPEAWERLGHNPVALLSRPAEEKLDAAAADESFVAMVRPASPAARRVRASEPGWLRSPTAEARDMLVAYFSLEFGLHESLPIYSGGLGVLAGDHLKTRQRPGRAAGRRRPALPRGLLPPVPRRRRLAAGALPRERLSQPAAVDRSATRTGSAADRRASSSPGDDRARARSGGSRSAASALPARHQHRGQLAARTARSPAPLYGGDQRHAHPPGDRPRHRRRPRPRARRA